MAGHFSEHITYLASRLVQQIVGQSVSQAGNQSVCRLFASSLASWLLVHVFLSVLHVSD